MKIKGVFHIDPDGYRRVKKSGHPRADKNGYVKEHFLFAEGQIGRSLLPGEIVHHTDLAKGQINPFGLAICASDKEHKLLHQEATAIRATGNKDSRTCYYCKSWDNLGNLKKNKSGGYFHPACHTQYNKRYKKARPLEAP